MIFARLRPIADVWYRRKGKNHAYGQCIVTGINRYEKFFQVREGNIKTGRKVRVRFKDISIISREELKSHCERYAKKRN